MKLPIPAPKYDPAMEMQRNRILEQTLGSVYIDGQDIEVGGRNANRSQRLILKAPDGSRWSVTVSNAGVLAAAAI